MKRLNKLFCWIALSFMLLGIMIGYAAMADTLTVTGGVSYKEKPFEGVHITKVEVYSQNSVSSVEVNYIKPTNLQSTVEVSRQNATVTFAITVENNTDVTYWFTGVTSFEEYGQNDLVNTTNGVWIDTFDHETSNSTLFDEEDWLPPDTTRLFYATYRFGPNATGTVATLVNFSFGLQMDAVHDEFLNVLNDKTSELGYYYLAGLFDEKYAETGQTVIGNVGEDAKSLENLFGKNMTLEIDGVEKPVTIMIERNDVDGNENSGDSYSGTNAPVGCEYTIYITVDDLSNEGDKATVYAVTYTCGVNGYWYQIGELYEGTSSVIDYDTTNDTHEGSFDVDTWIATEKTYTVIDGVTYIVGADDGQTIDKLSTIEELMSVRNDTEFYNKVNNNSTKLLKPVCQIVYSYRHENGKHVEYINEANRYKEGYKELKIAFDRMKPYCFINNGGFERLDNANALTRAELIYLLEDVQHAYEYYIEMNPNG